MDANITADDIINASEASGDISITGSVGGDVQDGDVVSLTVNGNSFTGVASGGTFSIDVPGSDLVADGDATIAASVTTSDVAGNVATATDTEGYTINEVPIAIDDSFAVNEDTALFGNVLSDNSLGADSDPNGDSLTVNIAPVSGPTNGSLTLNTDGTFDYVPDEDFNGTDSFTYQITDGNGGTDTATVNITINSVVDAVNDTLTTDEDMASTLNVLTNDSFGPNATITGVTQGANGTVTIGSNGEVTYTPNSNFNGTDSYTYTVTTDAGDTEIATVSVTVNSINDGPVANNDSATTNEDNAVTVAVLPNDSDGDGGTLQVTQVTDGTNGTAIVNANGTITYTPNPNFNGTDTVTYTLSDGQGGFDTATLTVTVNAVNDAPVISAVDSAVVSEEGLAAGIADTVGNPVDMTDSAVFTGTYSATDIESASLTATFTGAGPSGLTSGGQPITFILSNSDQTLTGSAGGNDIIRFEIDNDGGYQVTLLGSLDHPNLPGTADDGENVLNFDVGIRVSDGDASADDVINISIEDDSPISGNLDLSLIIPPSNTNLSFVIDVSGSMGSSVEVDDGSGGTVNIERLQLALESVRDVIQTYANLGDVRVQITTFSTASSSLSTWVSAAEALALIGDGSSGSRSAIFNTGGGTNYDLAVAEFQSSFSASGALNDSDPTVTNVSYFISDGEPQTSGGSEGTSGITGAEIAAYTDFLVANEIDAFAVGFGGDLTAADQGFLDPLAYDGISDTDRMGVIVTDASTLANTLLLTIDATASGNLFGAISNAFGADGGVTMSITIDGITYDYDPTADTITPSNGSGVIAGIMLDIVTSNGGALNFDFTTGEYQYTADDSLALNTSIQEIINFVTVDGDGDQANGTVTLSVVRGLDTDNDGIIDVIDIDDDNDGIIDTVEDAFLVASPFTTTTTDSNIPASGGNSSQNINLSAFGVAIGDTVSISNLFAQGDLNGGAETFTLLFNGGVTTGAVNTGSQDFGFNPVTSSVGLNVQVIDIGGGVAGISVSGSTTGAVGSFNGFVGVDYRFDIDGIGTSNDADGDGIINSLDVDSDNDGILDNVEAQAIGSYVAPSGIDANNDGLDDAYAPAGLSPVDGDSNGIAEFIDVDSDGDGISDIDDIDDDNDGILDTIEDAQLSTSLFTTTTSDSNILPNGGGTATQAINLSSFGVAIGSSVTINNVFARGDINGDGANEFFDLIFINSDGSGANTSFTGLQTDLNGGVEDSIFRATTSPVNATVTVVDIGGGVPGFVVQGVTGAGTDFIAVNGVDYRFDISGIGTFINNDADNDGIINSLDVDSDNDGILDNVEAQAVGSYVAPSGIDANNDGLDDVYGPGGITVPTDSNGDGEADFVSIDSDGDGTVDGQDPATLGNDRLVGSNTGDTINGLNGDDQLFGQDGNDTLLGGAGIDFLYGGEGDDTLTGGSDSDTFVWRNDDEGTLVNPASDTITDFTAGAGGDKLNLADLLHGEESDTLTDYLHFEQDGSGGTVISIDTDGSGTFESTQEITLSGTDLTAGGSLNDQQIVDNLLSNGNLIVD